MLSSVYYEPKPHTPQLLSRSRLVEVAGVEPASEDTASEASTSLVSCFGLSDASSHDRDEALPAF